MALNKFEICSRALIKVGANVISSFDEDTTEAEVASLLYESTRDALLSSHPWTFATKMRALDKLTSAPVADYDHAYQLPNDCLRVVSVGSSDMERGRGVAYRIAERKIHANWDGLNLTYIFRPAESEWPPFFDQALVFRLAAEFCLPLTENTARTEMLEKAASSYYQSAKTSDSQQQTPRRVDDFSLISVRG